MLFRGQFGLSADAFPRVPPAPPTGAPLCPQWRIDRTRHGRERIPAAGVPRFLAAAPQSTPIHDPGTARRLSHGFLALAAMTYGLIVLGALVRAHGAGLACPDWPLCFGELIPRFDFKIAFEWGHRALAGTIGLLFALLAALTLRSAALRGPMWKGLLVTAVLLATQIVLGGLTVLELLAYWTVTSHLVTGNAFALALVLISRQLGRIGSAHETDRSLPATGLQRAVTTAAGGILAIQLVLGGLVASNYAGLACPDWPTCMNGEFFPTWTGIQGLHVFHRVFGYTATFAICAAAWLGRSHGNSRLWIVAAAWLCVGQIAVGVANVLLRVPVEITGLHSALAAGLVCTVGVSVREVWRRD
jgi:cytochrome c oxidase assembly protein subunit 15